MSNTGTSSKNVVRGLLGSSPSGQRPEAPSAKASPAPEAVEVPPQATPPARSAVKKSEAKTLRLSPAVDARLREKFIEARQTTDPLLSFREFCDRMMTAGMDADARR